MNKENKRSKPQVRFIAFPRSYENKVGFDKVRELLSMQTESAMGVQNIATLKPTLSKKIIELRLAAVSEMMEIISSGVEFPSLRFADLSQELKALSTEGTYIAREKLPQFLLFLRSCNALREFLSKQQHNNAQTSSQNLYPILRNFLVPNIELIVPLLNHVEKLLDRFGNIRDNATHELLRIRSEKKNIEKQSSQIARHILLKAIEQGWTESDALPTLRDGHIVIPINPSYKRKVRGIVYDESSTGKTSFIEPFEVIENNNRLRELENDELREIIHILVELANHIRPSIPLLLSLYNMVGIIDGIKAIALFAIEEHAIAPKVIARPIVNWLQAQHPLLRRSLAEQGKAIIPLNIRITFPNERILVISGPNAGGKSVCLKTVALLQYMLQCGIPIPIHPDSQVGIFHCLAVNIGDDQSLEDDLSTYSSHLSAMASFCKLASPHSLLMIDEFGAGTEPESGGAIAEALLNYFNQQKSFGVITTHYRNIKQFAANNTGVINGAMLYNRGEMRPMFQLAIGHPGSSFAMQIAKRAGLPNIVLDKAEELTGSEYIDTDNYVQDIARDKYYWQRKRDEIRKKNNELENRVTQYEDKLVALNKERKRIIDEAKIEAANLLKQSNALIERTVREIKESQADKYRTQAARRRLTEQLNKLEESRNKPEDLLYLTNKHNQKNNQKEQSTTTNDIANQVPPTIQKGSKVMIMPEGMEATVMEIKGDTALLAIGNLSLRKPTSSLQLSTTKKVPKATEEKRTSNLAEHLHEKKVNFKEELDVRGLRAMEALEQTDYFIDEAIQVGCTKVRILHGTGTGALKQSIRQWLSASPLVKSFEDEDVRFGGAGITIVHL